jgi:hypothetical protein
VLSVVIDEFAHRQPEATMKFKRDNVDERGWGAADHHMRHRWESSPRMTCRMIETR